MTGPSHPRSGLQHHRTMFSSRLLAKALAIMKNTSGLLAIVILFLMSSSVRGEGGCPPGQYPQSGQGWQTCVPIPETPGIASGSSSPQVTWEDSFGAIANDSDDRAAGAAAGRPTQERAIADAISDCKAYGGIGCKQGAIYRNTCVAVVSGEETADRYFDQSEDRAVAKGMSACALQHQAGCHVFYSACSLPTRHVR